LEIHSYRILCVDDDAGTLKARRLLLEAAGYAVLTANSGEQVLNILDQGEKVDLVLLDFTMGGMDGDELASNLRKRDPQLPLILVSATEEVSEAFMKMLNGRVRKGQNPEVLLSTISSVLAKSQHGGPKTPAGFAGTVLCIDDEQLQLQLRTMLFEAAGFKVLQARSASLALEIFRTQQVDAVVMDYWLSGTNGTTIAEEMKRLQPRIPIVMLSGYSSLPGEGAVVDAWLRKAQVEPEEIVNAVKRLIGFHTDVQRSS